MTLQHAQDIIDLQRYPIDKLDTPQGQAFLADCKKKLSKDGAVVLEGFMKPDAVKSVIDNVTPNIKDAFYCSNAHNAYLIKDDPQFDADHPRNRKVYSDKGIVAYDEIPQDNLLHQVYGWQELKTFIAKLMDSAEIFPYEDPLGSVNININKDGRQLGWHYDNSKFVTTLMLQPAGEGGVYEYVPWLRSEQDQNYEGLDQVLAGTSDKVEILEQGAGAFVLFMGKYTAHRVTPSHGDPRLVAVLSYGPEPGKTLTEETRKIFYGRTG